MKIAFALRADHSKKPGGDTKKVDRYRERLGKFGWSTAIVTTRDDLAEFRPDICHIVNLDLPLENLKYARAARSHQIPVVLSTVSHPYRGLIGMYNHSSDRYFRTLRNLGVPPERGLISREWAKRAVARDAAPRDLGIRLTEAQKRVVDLSSAILPMARGEEAELQHRFGQQTVTFVPNGLNFEVSSASRSSSELVAVVGRIEPRKNSLEVARAAALLPHRFVFAGTPNVRHAKYVSAFMKVVGENENLTFVGNLDRNGLSSLLTDAEYYLNASWCEVVSQADMEAAAMGCRLVIGSNGYSDEFLTDSAVAIDPLSVCGAPRQAASNLAAALEESSTNMPTTKFTWDGAAERLDSAYRSLL